jgi:hypothetical protein
MACLHLERAIAPLGGRERNVQNFRWDLQEGRHSSIGRSSCSWIFVAVLARVFRDLGGNSSSLGRHEKAVHNLDIWHAHRQSSREEPMHHILHKSIIINAL